MKNVLLILMLLPVLAFGQSRFDYERAMGHFMTNYNHKRTEKIINLFAENKREFAKTTFDEKGLEKLREEYGKITFFKDRGTNKDGLRIFETTFSKRDVIIGFTLTEDNEITIFKFDATSEKK